MSKFCAQIFDKSKLWGCSCTPSSYTIGQKAISNSMFLHANERTRVVTYFDYANLLTVWHFRRLLGLMTCTGRLFHAFVLTFVLHMDPRNYDVKPGS